MKLLIASASFGTGHNQVAGALAEAALAAGHDAETMDSLSESAPLLSALMTHGFIQLLKTAPDLYRMVYEGAELPGQMEGLKQKSMKMLSKLMWPRLATLLARSQPDALLCTHPFVLGVMANLRRAGRIQIPLAGVLTDFAPHAFWLHPGVDAYYVATPAMTRTLVSQGVAPQQVTATGIPIRDAFAAPPDRCAAAESLGLDPHRPTVLVMGGGLGMGPIREMVLELCRGPRPLQVLVVAGLNRRLYEQLLPASGPASEHGVALRVYGYIPYVERLMAASDLLVTKAGAVTAAEALAVGLPSLLVDSIPGHEQRNEAVLVASGAARALQVGTMGGRLTQLLDHGEELAAMRHAARQFGRPEAARRVIEHLAGLQQQSGVYAS